MCIACQRLTAVTSECKLKSTETIIIVASPDINANLKFCIKWTFKNTRTTLVHRTKRKRRDIELLKCTCIHTSFAISRMICLFVCFVALRPKSTAMVMAERPVHITTLVSWASLNKQLTSTSCTYFRL